MRQLYLTLSLLTFALYCLPAQTGCPGCVVMVPAGLPDDTLYLPLFPNGEKGTPYNEDISFRVPKTSTPVHAVDTTTPPGLPISKIEIVGIENMPPGLHWEANQTVFETATQTDGCIKICGTPTKSDTFVMTVKLKATVLIFTQEASFPIRLYIAPKVSTTDGFTMANYTGCGSTTVSFSNNIPSGGDPGFSYEWDFGDSTTFTGENPPPHTYTKPGLYPVHYKAVVDTAGYRLLSATVLSVDGCTDQFGLGSPDLYLFILNPSGSQVYNSSPAINNTTLPHTFQPDLLLEKQGSYRLEVWDEDSGIEGSDDPCGTIYFDHLNDGDTLVSGSFRVVLSIDHPVDSILSADTVLVYNQPVKPKISANIFSACIGSDTIVLESSYGAGNQWWYNGQPISGATDFLYMPENSGYYQVQVNTIYGCSAISDSAAVNLIPLPAAPVYGNDRNNLKLLDTAALPANYALQWYLFAGPIAGATGFTYCATMSGDYSLVVTDLATGCTNSFQSGVVFDPNFDCTVGTGQAQTGDLRIYPNPARDLVTIQLASPLQANGQLAVWDVAGRLMTRMIIGTGTEQMQLDAGSLPQGLYFLELNAGEQHLLGQLVIVR